MCAAYWSMQIMFYVVVYVLDIYQLDGTVFCWWEGSTHNIFLCEESNLNY